MKTLTSKLAIKKSNVVELNNQKSYSSIQQNSIIPTWVF
jgi:hypothetical protein